MLKRKAESVSEETDKVTLKMSRQDTLELTQETSSNSDSNSDVDSSPPLVFFDLETTGLGDCHITQIAAVKGEDIFNRYVIPKKEIEKMASNITGIKMKNGEMFHHNKKVDGIPIRKALEEFLDYIGDKVLLVAHNAEKFDRRVLKNAAAGCGVDIDPSVAGFIDTLPLFKNQFPGLRSYSQTNLFKTFFPSQSYDAHDAKADVLALQELWNKAQPSEEVRQMYTIM